MSQPGRKVRDVSGRQTLEILQELLRDFHPRDFAIELWEGTNWPPEESRFHRFTWKIRNPDALWKAASSSNREVAFAEQYISGDFDILGDIEAAFPLGDYLIHKEWSTSDKLRLVRNLLKLPARQREEIPARPELRGPRHTLARDQAAVRYHYDVSNDFYSLWLDKEMIYSCGYFERADEDIDTAQERKLDSICRKLQLKTGDRFLDIGCGWGALVIHAARNYGVHALGITLSRAQFELARQRVNDAGLSEKVQIRILDYRQLGEREVFDKIASVGMVEHVGESNLPIYFRSAFRLLRPGGVFLNSGIARAGNRPASRQPTFTDLYVFPDGELETIGSLSIVAEQAGFEIRDVESLREHYYLTTLQWLRRLEARAREAQQIVGDRTYRIWRLYLAGSAYYFQKGLLNLYQTLLVKADRGRSGRPLTRSDWQS